MTPVLKVAVPIRFKTGKRGRKHAATGPHAAEPAALPCRIPRISRLMALAIRIDELIRSGRVRDYADVAALGHVSRARVCQVTSLMRLSPRIQEAILFLPPVASGRDRITERALRPIAALADWNKQKRAWERMISPKDASTSINVSGLAKAQKAARPG